MVEFCDNTTRQMIVAAGTDKMWELAVVLLWLGIGALLFLVTWYYVRNEHGAMQAMFKGFGAILVVFVCMLALASGIQIITYENGGTSDQLTNINNLLSAGYISVLSLSILMMGILGVIFALRSVLWLVKQKEDKEIGKEL